MLITLTDNERALWASWAEDTCSPDDLQRSGWQPTNPAWGHCDVTSLVLNDNFGGELVVGEVHLDGQQHGFHTWNRLGGGLEIDLTREQFRVGQTITVIKWYSGHWAGCRAATTNTNSYTHESSPP